VLKKFNCYGVDVSSGVEIERGVKDYNLMKKFIAEVKDAVK
jgi:phosphoribosylanthranilate isomerase